MHCPNQLQALLILSLLDDYPKDAWRSKEKVEILNLLTPNVNYSGRTAPLTSKVAFYIFIKQI